MLDIRLAYRYADRVEEIQRGLEYLFAHHPDFKGETFKLSLDDSFFMSGFKDYERDMVLAFTLWEVLSQVTYN